MNTEQLDSIMRSSGAVAWGVATAEPVDSEAWERREQWITDPGCLKAALAGAREFTISSDRLIMSSSS